MKSQFLNTTSLTATGLLLGAAFLPAGSAFAAGGCADDAELVADGICEVTFTETPDSAWTPPAGITKLQALLVGGGGAAGESSGDGYGGGGGGVQLFELATTGDVTIVSVGLGGVYLESDGGDTEIAQGSDGGSASGGQNGAPGGFDWGGDSGNGFQGDEYELGGAGAGGGTNSDDGGAGLVVNEIDPDVFDLFANDDRCFGGGGAGYDAWNQDGSVAGLDDVTAACNAGSVETPAGAVLQDYYWQFTGQAEDLELTDPVANFGGGAAALDRGAELLGDGADGIVVLRYDVALAETGFDSTGAIAGGAALVAGGVALAVRRRRASN